jgi:alkylhydroperoxidase family enzyme
MTGTNDMSVRRAAARLTEDSNGPIVEGMPRRPGPLEPLTLRQMPTVLRVALDPKVKRLGYLGAFFAFMARQPRALYNFHLFTEEAKTGLASADLVDVLALTVATSLGNDYERTQHERLALRRGRTAEWISAASTGRPTTAPLTDEQWAARALATRVVSGAGHDAESELQQLTNIIGQDRAVAALLLIGRYVAHAHIANALNLTAPRGEAGRDRPKGEMP